MVVAIRSRQRPAKLLLMRGVISQADYDRLWWHALADEMPQARGHPAGVVLAGIGCGEQRSIPNAIVRLVDQGAAAPGWVPAVAPLRVLPMTSQNKVG